MEREASDKQVSGVGLGAWTSRTLFGNAAATESTIANLRALGLNKVLPLVYSAGCPEFPMPELPCASRDSSDEVAEFVAALEAAFPNEAERPTFVPWIQRPLEDSSWFAHALPDQTALYESAKLGNADLGSSYKTLDVDHPEARRLLLEVLLKAASYSTDPNIALSLDDHFGYVLDEVEALCGGDARCIAAYPRKLDGFIAELSAEVQQRYGKAVQVVHHPGAGARQKHCADRFAEWPVQHAVQCYKSTYGAIEQGCFPEDDFLQGYGFAETANGNKLSSSDMARAATELRRRGKNVYLWNLDSWAARPDVGTLGATLAGNIEVQQPGASPQGGEL